ncbi:hypothetical protein BH09BAC2_BH09BAC2_21300 [soil metagenome]
MILYFIDFINFTLLKERYHFIFSILKFVVLISMGVYILRKSLSQSLVKYFVIVYISLWVLFFLMKMIVVGTGNPIIGNSTVHLERGLDYYLRITQLLTPLPVIFFYFLNRLMYAGLFDETPEKSKYVKQKDDQNNP